jgi:hypothetical protein
MSLRIPENFPAWSVGWNLVSVTGSTMPPRDPNDDDDDEDEDDEDDEDDDNDDNDEDDDNEREDDREAPVIREPDEG